MGERELVVLYAQEAREGLEGLLRDALALEAAGGEAPGARDARLRGLMRRLHALKGGAMVVEAFAEVGELLHAAEGRVAGWPRDRAPGAGEVELLVRCVDAARAGVDAVLAGGPAGPGVAALRRALGAEAGAGAPAPGAVEPPAGAEAPAPEVAEAARAGGDTVRVGTADLDALSRTLAELAGCQGAHRERVREVEALARDLAGAEADGPLAGVRARLERLAADLQRDLHRARRVTAAALDGAARLRLQPFSAVFDHLRRAVRDLERRTGKRVELALEGGDVPLDKRALDELRPALLHLLRNAVDHGLEPAEERRRAGKPAEGRLRVAAARRAGRVLVTVEDDGAGVLEEAVRARLRARGRGGHATLLDALSDAGSTREEATSISGRGVGVGSVREAAERLGGRLELDSRPGRGCTFRLSLPPTLATRRGLLVVAGGQPVLLPAQPVLRILRLPADGLVAAGGRLGVRWGDGTARLVDLRAVLGLAAPAPGRWRAVVVVDVDREPVALEVDEVRGEEELHLQPLGPPIRRLRLLEGLAARADGCAVPVVDLAEATRSGAAPAAPVAAAPAPPPRPPRVLVVDDSVTTRTLQRGVLEGAGMEVTLACDGREALELVRAGGEFDLVVSDVEMPHLDGVELVRRLRAERTKEQLPVVLVTSVTEDALRARGMDAGADALILKQTFDPDKVLAVIRALLRRGGGP